VSPALVALTAEQLGARSEEVLDVYREAMAVDPGAAAARRSILQAHLGRDGLRAVTAVDGSRMVGVAYGYPGVAGDWWHDQVRRSLTPEQAQDWLADAFEVCELHVRPELHGTGLGRALLDALLSGPPARTAVLTTPDQDTRARRFYRLGGWEDLRRGLVFPGDPRVFAVLGKRLEPPRA